MAGLSKHARQEFPPSRSAEVRNPVLASAFGRLVSMRVRVGPLRALPPMTFWWIPVHENVERDTLIWPPTDCSGEKDEDDSCMSCMTAPF